MTDASMRTCLLCGDSGSVRMARAKWRTGRPVGGRMWEAIPRCTDRAACRERIEALGERWPLVEGRSDGRGR